MNTLNQRLTVLESTSGIGGGIIIKPVAMAKVGATGINERVANCSVLKTGVGKFTFSFASPRPTSNYVISLSVAEFDTSRDDIIIQVAQNSTTVNGFRYTIHEQDNSDNAGTLIDKPSFVLITDFD